MDLNKEFVWYFSQRCAGPVDVARNLGQMAVDEIMASEIESLDERAREIVLDAVSLATDVALRAAGVMPTWAAAYEAATAHVRPDTVFIVDEERAGT